MTTFKTQSIQIIKKITTFLSLIVSCHLNMYLTNK